MFIVVATTQKTKYQCILENNFIVSTTTNAPYTTFLLRNLREKDLLQLNEKNIVKQRAKITNRPLEIGS